jgi:hypothetical protein
MPTPPTVWKFNEADRQAYADRFWRLPTWVVTAGLLAKLWREPGTKRGGGTVTSVLPILALHVWPEQTGAAAGWTGWAHLSRRRLAALAGLNKDSVGTACRRLVALRLMETTPRSRAGHEGGYAMYYRLSTALYPKADQSYAAFPANILYGGVWAMLPSPACRQLYLAILGLDSVRDEQAYLDRIGEDVDGDWTQMADDDDRLIADPDLRAVAIQRRLLAEQRARHPLSIRDLVRYSGLQRSTVVEALAGLLEPMFGICVDPRTGHRYPPIVLLKRGEGHPGRPTWYAANRDAWEWPYSDPRK